MAGRSGSGQIYPLKKIGEGDEGEAISISEAGCGVNIGPVHEVVAGH
jgi:hypothetical protein